MRVDAEDGTPCGAGVLLDDRHALTCAHVVRYAGAGPEGTATRVRISSVACREEWSRTARVAPGSWVHRNGTRRGDVALLELDEPAECGTVTTLWRAPISGGRVRVYGFPRAEPFGIGADAELSGPGGRAGEWGLLNQVRDGGPWIEEGYSGAGVMALGGEFDRHVIGIVVADYVNGDARAAWMLPTETVLAYLPQIERFIDGGRTNHLGPSAGSWPDDVLGDTLRLALTRELTGLLGGGWSGTAVVGTGGATGAGASWLLRLVRTADPAARAGFSDAELTDAPGDTVLGLGAIDAAYDARDRSVADVRGYLADRFGLPGGGSAQVVGQLLRRKPPACVVVGSVDRAENPEALVRELLGPLARRARTWGMRLVIGVEDRPSPDLAYEVSLDPGPLTGGPRAAAPKPRRRPRPKRPCVNSPPRRTRPRCFRSSRGGSSSARPGCRRPPRPGCGCAWPSPASGSPTPNSPRSTPAPSRPSPWFYGSSAIYGGSSRSARSCARAWNCTGCGRPGSSATRTCAWATCTPPPPGSCGPRRSI